MKFIVGLTAACGLLFSICGLHGVDAQTVTTTPHLEKRVALVIGNGGYKQEALSTAANDAGLIAQTLQAAGFDVVGARDLDGETLRKSFRDFIQKVQAAGPDTVAMVYLAGYGLQLSGENYFVPVDANILRDTDVAVEALRISDYSHQLAALPLKAGVIVLDAARVNPFAKQGQPLAGGLAMVEPENNMLIAFNAAPGTVAPEGAPPYGAYAQALAEMIRAGGMQLPEVFDRVRLRVNEMTKGAEIPWNAQKINSHFVFFERAPDAPAVPDQTAALRSKPIRDFDAKEAYIAALERDSLSDYENFLIAFPNDPLARRVRAIVAARREAITWGHTWRTDTPPAYWSYLDRYPRGPHVFDARRRLAFLSAALAPPQSFVAISYDVPPPPPDEIVYVDRPVLYFSDPVFAFVPPPPPPVFFLPPPPQDFIVLPPPPPPIGVFVLPTPLFVAMPTYVSPPTYVAPPPNNIIYNNIHNTTVINNVINAPPSPAASSVNTSAAPGVAQVAAPAAAASLPPAVAQRASLAPAAPHQAQPGTPPVTNPALARPSTSPAVSPNAVAPSATIKPLPGANGQPLPKPAIGARPAVMGGTAPTSNPAATPVKPALSGSALRNAARLPESGTVPAASAKPSARAATAASKPAVHANVTPAKPPTAAPRPKAAPVPHMAMRRPPVAAPRPAAVRVPPPRVAPTPPRAAPPRPQVQARVQPPRPAARPAAPRPAAPCKGPACKK